MTLSIHQILHISRSGMMTRLLDLDVVSHNLANINTHGFKASRSNFQEMFQQRLYSGVQLRTTQRFMDQGAFKLTARELDLAINGEGFFGVALPDGRTAYTRDGEFMLDSERRIVNGNGFPLVWDGSLPEEFEEINVETDGSVMVLQNGVWNQVGTIQLTRFPNPNGLESYGSNLWLETEVSGATTVGTPSSEGFGEIRNHVLEMSNVNIANELTQMILLQRSFSLSQRTFQQTDTMLGQAIQMRRT
ncbi:MAG: flagellar hook-basal body complex protein [Anaerolineales bacterium]|nr:flagellar hook-basal body complex protein [Anaerolineales bacterium]